MINRISILIVFFVSFLFVSIQAASFTYRVKENNDHKLRVVFNFTRPTLQKTAKGVYTDYERAGYTLDASGAYLPIVSKLFNLGASRTPNVRVISQRVARMPFEGQYLIAPSPPVKPIEDKVTVKYLGLFKDVPLFSLNLLPVQVSIQDRQIIWTQTIELEISVPGGNNSIARSTRQKSDFLSGQLLAGKQIFTTNNTQAGSASLQKTQSPMQSLFSSANIFKLIVNEDGIYKITYQDLQEAGFPVDQVNPQLLKLYNKGAEIPIFFEGEEDGVFNENDYFEFWGEKNKKTFFDRYPDLYQDPFTDENVYWLAEGTSSGLRLTEESGGLANTGRGYVFTPYAYTETLHFEEDRHYEHFGDTQSLLNRPAYEFDHWFFDSGISAPEGVAYDFYVPHPFESGSDVVVRAAFRGKSFYDGNTNPLTGHQFQLKLRGKGDKSKLIAQIKPSEGWNNQEMRIVTNADSAVKLPQSILNNGNNRLEVDMFQTGVTDIILLNWFEITYLRKYRAYKDFIKFHVDPEFFNNTYINYGDTIQINIDGFDSEDIEVYKLGVSKIINGKIDLINDGRFTSYGVSIQDQIFDPNTKYVALTEKAKKKPVRIVPFTPYQVDGNSASLLSQTNAADYLIITHELFYKNVMKLKELKEQQGYRVAVVTVENIYDAFNYGIKSPLAIKDFIRYVYRHWDASTPLKYVVFVGKGSYDTKNIFRKDADLVPTMMYQTFKFGAAASDYWYSEISGEDNVPDVIVARIPVATNQELLNYIDKIEHYQNGDEISVWRNKALFISGKDNDAADVEYLSNGPIFRSQNLRLINYRMPKHLMARRLNTIKDDRITGFDPNFGGKTDLIDYFDDGLGFINFLGHGGGGIWADVDLLNLDDVDRLNNGYKLPFVASMTCFTGAFENPGRKGIAEKMLIAEKKGAIAVLASSGLGWRYNDFAVEWGLFDFLWNKNFTFGEAVTLMKIAYLSNPVYATEYGLFDTYSYSTLHTSMVHQYNLLGDPALKIQQPAQKLQLSVDNPSPAVGDTVTVHVKAKQISSGTLNFEVTDQKDSLIYETTTAYSGATTPVSFVIPAGIEGRPLNIKAYVSDQSADAAGYARMAVNRPVVTGIAHQPTNPKVSDPISFELTVFKSDSVQSLTLQDFRDNNRASTYPASITMDRVNDTLFRSHQPFPGFPSGGHKYFDIHVVFTNGRKEVYRLNTIYIIDPRPDIAVDGESISYGGSTRPGLNFTVENLSDTTVTDFYVACYDEYGILNQQPFYQTRLSLTANQSKQLFAPYDSVAYKSMRIFKVSADISNAIDERDEINNTVQQQVKTSYVYVKKNLGTSSDGNHNQPVTSTAGWSLYIPANTLQSDAVIKWEERNVVDLIKGAQQKELEFTAVGQSDDSLGIELKFPANVEQAGARATVSVPLTSEQLQGKDKSYFSIYRYDDFLNLWVKVPSQVTDSLVQATVTKSGYLAVFYGYDQKVPYVEVTANGRPLVDNSLIVKNPLISLILQDENGVDYTHSLNLSIDDQILVQDGKPLIPGQVSIPDSLKSAKVVSISTSPKLTAGTHTLEVTVADVNGNVTSKQLSFVVNDEFDIKVYGNYPNPFSDQTIISFFVNSDNEIDDFSIKIYTTSGRLIRKTDLLLDESIAGDNVKMPSYHELIWDGTDDDGNQVGNGVYFAVIRGKYKGKTVEHVLKIARLQ